MEKVKFKCNDITEGAVLKCIEQIHFDGIQFMCTVLKIRATDGTWDAVQISKIFHREVNVDDGGFYRHDVCWNFHQSTYRIYRVSWTFHGHLWGEPGNWTTGPFPAKFMEMYEA